MSSTPPIIWLMGPTAAGKTDLAIRIARRLPVEIVSVDSALVYRGMDIGTAKPEPHVLAEIRHHLVDILEPTESYSAAQFRADALEAIASILARGRIPLLTGGTMLYFRALEHGLSELPPADPEIRARLEREAHEHGWPALHARLAQVDPEAAGRIHANDPQRIQRALEVFEITGQPLSSLQKRAGGEPFPYPLAKWVVAPKDRSWLHARIAERFRQMLAKGFVDEVVALRARGDLDLSMPSMRAVGYRQVWEYLDGRYDYGAMVERGIAATRQFAKRQLTWLRAERDAEWFASEEPQQLERLVARATALWT
ncbi:MAG: tRNA (adenosine(37)-N6)-dimethylallyltransferase MiaA [Xanthomonadaceae bacterium]|nr:tRNA (adenosine(37)-N6)-dimethylallyltransferase MiaA [Xanthomonadaceae bacterium]